MLLDLPYLKADRNQHGTPRLFVRRHGRAIRIREQPGTPEFLDAYRAAISALDRYARRDTPVKRSDVPAGSLGWLAAKYFAHAAFTKLPAISQATRRGIIESCLKESIKPSSTVLMAFCPLAHFSAAHLRTLRDRRTDKPGAANNRLKYLGSMLSWAVEQGHIPANPARDVKRLRYATDGFHAWTPEEVKQFEARHPIGTKARLAMSLMLFLGLRRGDVVLLGRQHVQGSTVRFIMSKTRHRKLTVMELPIIPELARIIAASPTGDLTYLMTEWGKPFAAAGFGNWFRDRCNEAGLPQCSAHGLRKAGAAIAAERGATDRQLMALYGWESARQATTYTRSADRKKMAAQAAPLLGSDQTQNTDCLTESVSPYKQLK